LSAFGEAGRLACDLAALAAPHGRALAAAEAKLARLLRHAGTAVPWYRRLFAEAGLDPRRADRAALARLPVTRKAHWRDRLGADFHAEGVDLSRCRWLRSSGTTGPAAAIPILARDRLIRRVGTQRAFRAAGLGLRDRYAWVRAAHGALVAPPVHERAGFLRTRYVDLLEPPDQWWPGLVALAPRGLLGFPLETEAVARRVAQGRLPPLPHPVVCGLYGEHIDAEARGAIETALGPVREMYGSAEAGTIAWSCGRGPAWHVNADFVIVEFLEDGVPVPPGARGEVVVTNLHSWAMPVIRYGQGDIGWEEPSPCPCGRPGPLMRIVPGFRQGPFRLPSGRRVAARFFVQAMPSLDWVLDWEVEQPEPDRLAMTLTTSRPVPRSETDALASAIAAACWEPVRVEVNARVLTAEAT